MRDSTRQRVDSVTTSAGLNPGQSRPASDVALDVAALVRSHPIGSIPRPGEQGCKTLIISPWILLSTTGNNNFKVSKRPRVALM